MSLSPSLFEAYGKLYDEFSTGLFTFDDLSRTLDLDISGALKCASLLRARGHIVIFSRTGRKKLYRLLSPEQAFFANAHLTLDAVKQQRYVHLIVETIMGLYRAREIGLTGIWLFGSVARGQARSNSDVDLIAVAKNLAGSTAQMVEHIYSVLDLGEEKQFLFEKGFSTDVSVYPLREAELGRFYPIMLDVIDHGIVLYQRGGMLSRASEKMREGARRFGVRKVPLRMGWMWILPSELEVGSPLEIQ